jgi:L-amino acid N-acyltransferase YncA
MTVQHGKLGDESRGAAAIRAATPDDLRAIVEIYNDVIETSSTIWSESLTTIDERLDWLQEKASAGYPVLVAKDHGVLGFIATGPFRPWPGYAKTSEHSIHVHRDARNRGVGGLLLDAAEQALRSQGIHVMVAGIDAENHGSIRFHARAGFSEVARMPEVGFLRGEWRDLVLVQKRLA